MAKNHTIRNTKVNMKPPNGCAAFPRLLAPLFLHHRSGDEAATKPPVAPSSPRMPFPDNAGPRAVGFKDEDVPGDVVPVQGEHGVAEAALRLMIEITREGVVDAATPPEFLKRGEHGDLIPGRLAKPFDHQQTNPKFSQVGIPGRFRPFCSRLGGAGFHYVLSQKAGGICIYNYQST